MRKYAGIALGVSLLVIVALVGCNSEARVQSRVHIYTPITDDLVIDVITPSHFRVEYTGGDEKFILTSASGDSRGTISHYVSPYDLVFERGATVRLAVVFPLLDLPSSVERFGDYELAERYGTKTKESLEFTIHTAAVASDHYGCDVIIECPDVN